MIQKLGSGVPGNRLSKMEFLRCSGLSLNLNEMFFVMKWDAGNPWDGMALIFKLLIVIKNPPEAGALGSHVVAWNEDDYKHCEVGCLLLSAWSAYRKKMPYSALSNRSSSLCQRTREHLWQS